MLNEYGLMKKSEGPLQKKYLELGPLMRTNWDQTTKELMKKELMG